MFRSQTDHHQGDTMLLQQQDKTGSNTHITTGKENKQPELHIR